MRTSSHTYHLNTKLEPRKCLFSLPWGLQITASCTRLLPPVFGLLSELTAIKQHACFVKYQTSPEKSATHEHWVCHEILGFSSSWMLQNWHCTCRENLTELLSFVVHHKFMKLVSQMNYSAAYSHKASVEKEPVFKASSLCLCTTSETVGGNENAKRQTGVWVGLVEFPRCQKNSQACPADDLFYGAWCNGLTWAWNQRQEDTGGRVSASGRLCRAGQGGRALLQGSARTRFVGGDHVGARSVTMPFFWLPVMGRREYSTVDEWCISTCCQLAAQDAQPNKVFRPGTKTWHAWGSIPFILQNVLPWTTKNELKHICSSYSRTKMT